MAAHRGRLGPCGGQIKDTMRSKRQTCAMIGAIWRGGQFIDGSEMERIQPADGIKHRPLPQTELMWRSHIITAIAHTETEIVGARDESTAISTLPQPSHMVSPLSLPQCWLSSLLAAHASDNAVVRTNPHEPDLMARGSERRSLLDGDIVKRERTAGETVDLFLAKLVDAFNFQIQESCLEAEREAAIARNTSDAYIAHVSSRDGAALSQQQEKQVNPFMRSVSEKLTAFLLNASIDDTLQERPMELGINSKQMPPERSSFSWLDRVTRSSEVDLLDKDDDVFFCTDDESEMLANYETMAYTPQARRTGTKA